MFQLILNNQSHFNSLAKVDSIKDLDDNFDKNDAGTIVIQGAELFIPMADLIDREKEKLRLEKEISRLEGLQKAARGKLNNKNFVEKAPEQVVQAEQNKLTNILENLDKVRKNYEKYQ